ncbi:HAD-like domain-containing protein [Fusarium oxysporum]|nr:HAD-like domain-containing protein [Fusarium oxysporum]
MNSLNILTARVSPPPSPTQSRSNSIGGGPIGTIGLASEDQHGDDRPSGHETESFAQDTIDESRFIEKPADESTPLLNDTGDNQKRSSWWHSIPRRFASSIIGSIRWVLATLASPGTNGRTSGYRRLTPRPRPMGSRSGRLSRHARAKSLQPAEETGQRKHRKTQSAVARTKASDLGSGDLSAHLKSPTSPIAALTKQPSYINLEPPTSPQKTLILDLDETLIHSMSKGGRMSTGHMAGVQVVQSGCFTASVQEYADPVIDWLEAERKYFSARYYRQHCTFRQGAFIKDLSSVESDLSKVMILDNSPLSYLFHQDNAIPIQGWINDPTDTDLMHLVPLLEGLQYVHDVRALLALRGGEDGQHMA